MPLKSFVDEARKTNALMEKLKNDNSNSNGTLIDISDGQRIPKEKLEEIQSQNKSNFSQPRAIPQNKEYTSFERGYIKKNSDYNITRPTNNGTQRIDERHNNIMANIIKKSSCSTTGNTTWENCKHKKNCDETIYCKEFMSLCGKEKCNRAIR